MERTILIADSGSTKTDWLLCHEGRRIELHTSGINPVRDAQAYIYNVLYHELLPSMPAEMMPEAVYFYGAGCTEPFSGNVRSAIAELLQGARAEVESDLLGAARALLGDEPGICCILGTGSNSCLYDGKAIAMHTPPLGYILGDEGSGSFLGKALLSGIFKKTLPEALREDFRSHLRLTMSEVIERVYRQPAANAFLASLVPFIAEHRSEPAVHALLIDAFRLFIQRNIRIYGHPEMPLHCVGGIAYQFESELEEAATGEGMQIGRILRRPIDGIAEYHVKKTN